MGRTGKCDFETGSDNVHTHQVQGQKKKIENKTHKSKYTTDNQQSIDSVAFN